MDFRRKTAEYDEAVDQYTLHKEFLRNLQESQMRQQAALRMPYTPLTLHEVAEVAEVPTRKMRTEFSEIWSNVFTNGWPWILVSWLVLWWWRKWLIGRKCAKESDARLTSAIVKREEGTPRAKNLNETH